MTWRAIAVLWLVACDAPTPMPTLQAGRPGPIANAHALASDAINPRLLRRFRPVVAHALPPASPPRVALGRALFFEPRLSLRQNVSCNSCHPLAAYGVDHRKTSPGTFGRVGVRNTPSVFNAAEHVAQFWDGRAATVEDQATGPILNPVEMAMPNAAAAEARLDTPEYAAAFVAAFPDDPHPITLHHVGVAIGAFERGLVTTSRWDRFLAGDATALTPSEKHGLHVFLEVGCMTCHTGPQVGGTMFKRLGVIEPWPDEHDPGRGAISGLESDRMVFKVPSLKNIDKTGPYLHDGSIARLDDVVRLMARHQLGVELDDDDVRAIVAWTEALTGSLDASYIAAP